MSELEEQISEVRQYRDLFRKVDEDLKIKAAEADSRFRGENKNLLEDREMYAELVKAKEGLLRELTLAAYRATGSKKPAPGVGVRVVKTLHYDEAEALAWAIESGAEACLTLQKTNFKKVAEGLELDFVKIEEVPTAIISKEL